MWKPSITPNDVLMHSQGPWNEHKYIKVVDGVYYYPNSYKDGHTISELKGRSSGDKDKKENKSSLTDEDIEKIANETIAGKHGNGDDRKAKFGDDYARIQNKVNEKLGSSKRHKIEEPDSSSAEKKDEQKETEKKSTKSSNPSKKKSSKKASKKATSNKTSDSSKKDPTNSNDSKINIDQLARDIIAGKYGNGKERQEKLGSDYAKAQNKVNEMLKNKKRYSEVKHSSIWAPSITPEDVLMHHGIQGQRWGHKNGPPYPLDASQKSSAERKYRTDKGYQKPEYTRKKKKKVSEMSNKELQKRVARKQLEQQYKDLSDKEVQRGKNKVLGYIKDYGTVAGAILTTAKLLKLAGLAG